MSAFTVGSLFAGIGGIDIGFERAGFIAKWQVEIDPYCRKVLAKNFPHAERFEDVRNCGVANLSAVDVIVGGFPCQDISNAGKRAGITGERSGLWSEYARIIRELRPRFVFVENVAALLVRGMDVVLGDLAALGYDAEWRIVSAYDLGAPHLRERVWIVAHSSSIRYSGPPTSYATTLDEERHYSAHRIIGGAVPDSLKPSGEDDADSDRNGLQVGEHVAGG
jgi:DNA (cytosine-5)-methyltransferase 1